MTPDIEISDTVNVVREEVLRLYRPDSCIETTRCLIKVLAYFGCPARPVPVHLVAYNAEGWEMRRAGVPLEAWSPTAWSVGVSGTDEIRGVVWDGHLVATTVVKGRTYLMDGSLDQFSRPERGIPLQPEVFELPDDWTPATKNLGGSDLPNDVHIDYLPVRALAWRTSAAWRGHNAVIRQVVASSIRRLKGSDDET